MKIRITRTRWGIWQRDYRQRWRTQRHWELLFLWRRKRFGGQWSSRRCLWKLRESSESEPSLPPTKDFGKFRKRLKEEEVRLRDKRFLEIGPRTTRFLCQHLIDVDCSKIYNTREKGIIKWYMEMFLYILYQCLLISEQVIYIDNTRKIF